MILHQCHGTVVTYCILAAACFRWTAADGFTSVYYQNSYSCRHHHHVPLACFRPSTVVPKRVWRLKHQFCRQNHYESSSLVSLFKPSASTAALLRGGSQSLAELADNIGASRTKCWILLVISISLEAVAISLSKQARDIKSMPLFLAACVLYLACTVGFNVSLAKIDVGVAYAAWSAIGTLLVTTVGIVFFREDFSLFKALWLSFIIFGVVGLNLQEQH